MSPSNAKRWRSSLGRGRPQRRWENVCAHHFCSLSSRRTTELFGFIYIVLGLSPGALQTRTMWPLFLTVASTDSASGRKKVLKLKLLPLVLEKAWLSVWSSCFAWKLVHRYTTLSIIEIKKPWDQVLLVAPQRQDLLVREVQWWDAVAQRQMSFLSETGVLHLQCPHCPLPHLSLMVNWLWSPLESIKRSSHLFH